MKKTILPLPYRLVLGSQSPRRRELLAGLDIDFEVRPMSDIDETYPEKLVPEEVAPYIARHKAWAYRESLAADELLLTADTVVLLNDTTILGKPHSPEEAYAMLSAMSGQQHKVITGVALMRPSGIGYSFSATSKVTFASLSDEEISYYIEHYHPYDKAGSYGIQEWIGYVAIESIEGSFYNVMGLPVHLVYKVLSKWLCKEKELLPLLPDCTGLIEII